LIQNALYIEEHTGKKIHGILIFGGDGINYEQPSPGSSFLQDLWILSIGKSLKGIPPHSEDDVEYTHTWTRVIEESLATSTNVLTSSNPAMWPQRRWNFGYTVTDQGWFLMYGGEDASSNVHFEDTWVFYENKWVQLHVFTGPHMGLGPGRRKGVSILVLPLSGLIVLWGGQRPSIGTEKRPITLSGVIEREEEEVEDELMINGGKARGKWKGPYVQCLSDTYIFNATTAMRNSVLNEVPAQSKVNSHEHLHLEDWRRVADFSGPCLCGAEAVGIFDPLDGKEKLFAFGGRYSLTGMSDGQPGKSAGAQFQLSRNIWLYDPLTNVWSVLEKDLSRQVNWPEGRDKHAMAYVAELNTVFVSGGRLADPTTPGENLDDGGTTDIVDMDLWGFDLVARKWSQYGDPSLSQDDYISSDDVPSDEDGAVAVIEQPASRGSENTFSVLNTYTGSDNNKWWVGVAGDLPAARYQHGLSVWRGTSGTERPFLVCFGGERSDTPWQLQGTGRGNLRATPAMEGAVGGAADQTAIDDDSFSGSGGGGTDNDNGGILGPVSSHAQSNDLWILPLPTGDAVSPFYEDKDEDGEGQISSYTSSNEDTKTVLYYGSDNGDRILSGGGDSGTRGGKGKGNIKGDNPHRRPIHHGNSNNTHSNGTIPISSNNSTAEGNKTDSVDERRNGWTLLSAGGCHYLDDGRYVRYTPHKRTYCTAKCSIYKWSVTYYCIIV
jgi:hypothetical protein